MAGETFSVKMPEVVKVNLVGRLQPWVSGKDVILELLRRLTVKGGTVPLASTARSWARMRSTTAGFGSS